MNPTTELPYELHCHGSGAFVVFDVGDQIALPVIALAKATLRAEARGDMLVLEFPHSEIAIEGRGLDTVLNHIVAGRAKKISRGCDADCEVVAIRFTENP